MSGQLVNLAILAIGGWLTIQNWPRIEAMLNDIMGSLGGGGAAAPPAGGEEYAEPAAGEGEPVEEAEGTEGEEGGEKAPTGGEEGGGGEEEDEESNYARAYRAYMVRAFAADPYWQRRRRRYLMKPRLYVI